MGNCNEKVAPNEGKVICRDEDIQEGEMVTIVYFVYVLIEFFFLPLVCTFMFRNHLDWSGNGRSWLSNYDALDL